MKDNYPSCYDFTLKYEGGYVDNPSDPGGCTNMGITLGTLQDWRGDPTVSCSDVEDITDEEVAAIYKKNYWTPVMGDDLPSGVDLQVWDFGVNAGPSRAIKHLQNLVGVTADGVMGPNTLAATQECYNDDPEALLQELHDDRQAYYEGLSTFSTFGDGWTARNDACLQEALDLVGCAPTDALSQMDDFERRISALEAWRKS